MKNYSGYIVESKLNSVDVELILEKSAFVTYKEIQKKVLKDYGSQLYFIATFNSAIVSMYPVVKQMLYNSDFNINLNSYQIVLLTIFTIAEILHVNNEAVKDIKNKIKEEGLLDFITEVKKALFSIKKIVEVVAKTVGKTISLFIDMLAYVTILVPVNDFLIEILKPDPATGEVEVKNIYAKVLGLGIGLGIISFKNIVMRILNKMGFDVNPDVEKKVEEIIKKDKENIYHKMRTKEKIK
jgi:hypothetical protein